MSVKTSNRHRYSSSVSVGGRSPNAGSTYVQVGKGGKSARKHKCLRDHASSPGHRASTHPLCRGVCAKTLGAALSSAGNGRHRNRIVSGRYGRGSIPDVYVLAYWSSSLSTGLHSNPPAKRLPMVATPSAARKHRTSFHLVLHLSEQVGSQVSLPVDFGFLAGGILAGDDRSSDEILQVKVGSRRASLDWLSFITSVERLLCLKSGSDLFFPYSGNARHHPWHIPHRSG